MSNLQARWRVVAIAATVFLADSGCKDETPGGAGGAGGRGVGGTTFGSGAGGAAGAGGTAGVVSTAGTIGTAGVVGTAGAIGTAGVVGTAGAIGSAGAIGTAGAVGSGGATAGTGGTNTGSGGQGGRGGAAGLGGKAGAAGATGGGGGSSTGGTGGATGIGGTGGVSGAVCTSGRTWDGSNTADMNPGMATCTGCHQTFTFCGTVYPTYHEPDGCYGANGATGVRVVVTGADGKSLTLTPTASGNFYSTEAVVRPFTARVMNGAASHAMVATQLSGNCNTCHSQDGGYDAPGRIVAP